MSSCLRELSADEENLVSGGGIFSDFRDLLDNVWDEVRNYFRESPHDARVEYNEDHGWDCFEKDNGDAICYSEDRKWQSTITPNGTEFVEPYTGKK